MTRYSERFQVTKYFNTFKFHKLKTVNSTFLSSSDMQKFHHLLGCHAIGINSSLISFLITLRFSNLICLTKKLS